jgi:hypothetical protein
VNRTFLLVVVALITLSCVLACPPASPSLNLTNNQETTVIWFSNGDDSLRTPINTTCNELFPSFYNHLNETIVRWTLESADCGFSPDEITDITNFITHGYDVIEQTDEEYSSFLAEANAENRFRPKDCLAYNALARKGRFTGFVKTNNELSSMGFCLKPQIMRTDGCGNRIANIFDNDLSRTLAYVPHMIIGILLGGLVVFIIVKRKK